MSGQRRPHRSGRGPRRHRLQVRGRHPDERAVDPQVGRPARRGGARRGGRRARPHQGGPGRPPGAVQEARPLREGLAQDRGRRRVRRAGRGHGHRGRQGRPDHRPRGARLPARLARRHPPRPEPRRVPRPEDRVQGHRAQPLAEQRGALAPRGARGGAQGGPPADPRPPPAGDGRGGRDLEHRGLRRVRGPGRHRRADPHLRALLEPREPPVRDPLDRRRRAGQGARHRPRAPAHLARSQADAGGSRGSASSTPTRSATSSRARSPRSSPSARSSRSWTGSRASCTSPSSPSTTWRTRARSSSRARTCA